MRVRARLPVSATVRSHPFKTARWDSRLSHDCPTGPLQSARGSARRHPRTASEGVWDSGRRIKKSFGTLAEAKAWRAEAQTAIRRGTMRAPSQLTLREVAKTWLAG